MDFRTINFKEKFSLCTNHWSPRIITQMNEIPLLVPIPPLPISPGFWAGQHPIPEEKRCDKPTIGAGLPL
jgi:hypothetical protein